MPSRSRQSHKKWNDHPLIAIAVLLGCLAFWLKIEKQQGFIGTHNGEKHLFADIAHHTLPPSSKAKFNRYTRVHGHCNDLNVRPSSPQTCFAKQLHTYRANLKAISLFSGCGGMDFACRSLGIDVLFANDIIPETKSTFERYFPEVDFFLEDIRLLNNFPKVDLVTGGYPCQSFSMGGKRAPEKDPRTFLFKEFARVVDAASPKFFVAENVSGLKSIQDGRWLDLQLDTFSTIGKHGYHIAMALLNSRDYGVPQRRKRVLIVGVRKDLGVYYHFPKPTHGKKELVHKTGLLPFASHGDAIRHLPLDAPGEYYERPHDPEGNFSWYYMSRNRKAAWADPAFTVVANFRHITLHPASPTMKLLWSNLADGWKQRWEFSTEYEHLNYDSSLPILELPRRLSWREAAAIQTFPHDFEPAGKLERKFEQIGNAVPPMLMRTILEGLVTGEGLHPSPGPHEQFGGISKQLDLLSPEEDTEELDEASTLA